MGIQLRLRAAPRSYRPRGYVTTSIRRCIGGTFVEILLRTSGPSSGDTEILSRLGEIPVAPQVAFRILPLHV